MAQTTFDLIVIGSGPGGYVAAIRAAQLGMRVACAERQYLGGTCLNVGCIPSKAMLDSSYRFFEAGHLLSRRGINIGNLELDMGKLQGFKSDVVRKSTAGVAYLLKKNNIAHLSGQARILSPTSVQVGSSAGQETYACKRILIATGSAPQEIPALPFDGKHIISSTEALAMQQVPKRMIVIGAGYIGVEMSSVFSRLGSQVLVLEFFPGILPPSDREMADALRKILEKQGIQFRFNTTAQSAKIENGKVTVAWKDAQAAGTEETDVVLVCVGRRPVTDNLGLEELGVSKDAKGFIRVNAGFTTSVPGIYAIGDVIGGAMLAHKAEEEGVAAVEGMAGHAAHVNYRACPAVVYTHPELAQVGLSEDDASKSGPIKVGRFPFIANGRARAMDQTEGFVKVIGDVRTDRLLGVHILASHAGDIISEAVMAMEFAGSVEDIARAFHAHPTLPEAIREAALAAEKRARQI